MTPDVCGAAVSTAPSVCCDKIFVAINCLIKVDPIIIGSPIHRG